MYITRLTFVDPCVPCCDLCDPSLLNQTRPAPPSRVLRKKKATPGVVDPKLKKEIVKWRKEVWTRDFKDSLFGPSAILSEEALESVSSFGKIERLIDLESALGGWAWFGRYGDELLNIFRRLDIAPMQAKPSKPRGGRVTKRAVEVALAEDQGGNKGREDQTKRRRTSDIAGIPPTPVQPRPAPLNGGSQLPPPSSAFAQHTRPQTIYPSPFSHNTHTMLTTPPAQFYQNNQSPYIPIYPYYYPTNTPYHWRYPHHTPRPPPPPP